MSRPNKGENKEDMQFAYSATKGKRHVHGQLAAASRSAALASLKARGLTVTLLHPVKRARPLSAWGTVGALEKVALTKHLAIMLRAGIPLDESLSIIELESRGRLKYLVQKGREQVEAGQSLAQVLARFPKVFSPYYVSMVHAGEESGNLVENLELVSRRLEKDYEMKKKVQAAMLYPAIVFALAVALAIMVSFFVLPRLTNLFRAFDFELPLSTRLILAAASFVAQNGVTAGILLIAAASGSLLASRLKAVRGFLHRFNTYLPVVRDMSEDINLARFCTAFSTLLSSGIPINKSLSLAASVVSNRAYRRELEAAIKRIDQGELLSDTLSLGRLYPPFVTRMLLVGETSGRLVEVLEYLGNFYEAELDNRLKNLSTVLEPILLIIVGCLVAFVALSIITPIYGFLSVFD